MKSGSAGFRCRRGKVGERRGSGKKRRPKTTFGRDFPSRFCVGTIQPGSGNSTADGLRETQMRFGRKRLLALATRNSPQHSRSPRTYQFQAPFTFTPSSQGLLLAIAELPGVLALGDHGPSPIVSTCSQLGKTGRTARIDKACVCRSRCRPRAV